MADFSGLWKGITSGLGDASDFLFGKADTTVKGMSDIYNNKRQGTSGLFGDIGDLLGITGEASNTDRFKHIVNGLGTIGDYQLGQEKTKIARENADIARRSNILNESRINEEQKRYDYAINKEEESEDDFRTGLAKASRRYTQSTDVPS